VTEPFAPFTLHTGIEIDLQAADAVANLRTIRGTANPMAWCDAAATVVLRLAGEYEFDDAHDLLELVIATLPPTRAPAFLIAFAAHDSLKYEAMYAITALNAAFELEPTIEIAMKLVRALVDDLAEDQIVNVIERVADDFAVQRQFFAVLESASANKALIDLARRATPTTREDRLVRATTLARALGAEQLLDERALVLAELEELVVDRTLDSTARTWAYLELGAIHHLEAASELVGLAPQLRAKVVTRLARALEGAGELVRAERLLLANPMPDEPQYLESVQRRIGTLAWPPPEAFVEPPPEPTDEVFAFFAAHGLPERFAAAFTRGDQTAMLREERAPAPEIIRAWSYGAIKTPEDLDSEKIFGPIRSYVCRCELYVGVKYRGQVCERCGTEVISNTTRTYRTAHITLEREVVHPWYGATLATLLGLRQTELRAATDLRDRLRRVNMSELYCELEAKHPRNKTDERLFTVVSAFHDTPIRAEWLVLDIVPVWAPNAELPAGVDRAKLRAAYVALLGNPDPQAAVDALYACFT
jgi:hypothetical protein